MNYNSHVSEVFQYIYHSWYENNIFFKKKIQFISIMMTIIMRSGIDNDIIILVRSNDSNAINYKSIIMLVVIW
jgi:hypothetical protein